MSQSARRKATCPAKVRERVARDLAEHLHVTVGDETFEPALPAVPSRPYAALLDGRAVFDVHAARQHAETIMVRAHKLSGRGHFAVFGDWTLAHPDAAPSECPFEPTGYGIARAKLGRSILAALEGQPSECQTVGCVGRRVVSTHGTPGQPFVLEGTWDLPRDHHGQVNGDGTFEIIHQCRECHGTGHNLRGVLPAWEPSKSLHRRALEHETHDLHSPNARESWVRTLADDYQMPAGPNQGIPIGSVWLSKWNNERGKNIHTPDTRVVDRGEHRWEPTADIDHDGDTPLMDQVRSFRAMRDCANHSEQHDVHARAWAQRRTWSKSQRGELRHAEQRLERLRRRDPIAAAVLAAQPAADAMAVEVRRLGEAAARAGEAFAAAARIPRSMFFPGEPE